MEKWNVIRCTPVCLACCTASSSCLGSLIVFAVSFSSKIGFVTRPSTDEASMLAPRTFDVFVADNFVFDSTLDCLTRSGV